MTRAEQATRIEALEAEVRAVRQANEGLRQAMREADARLVRQQQQFQEALARSQATEVELRLALAARLKVEASVAEEFAARHRPKAPPPAGQVGADAAQG